MKHSHDPHPAFHPWKIGAALLLGLLAIWSETAAGGDAAAGENKALFCATCHGLDGNTTNTGTPRLAGQPEAHFISRMKHYKAGRQVYHPMMALLTNGLTDQDIADLAAFYASRKPAEPAGKR